MALKKLTHREFVMTYYVIARDIELRTGLPLEISLTQGALESNWGANAYGNMFFGEKAPKSWTGKKQLLRTTEVFNDDKQGYRFPQVISITQRKDGKYVYVVRDWFKAFHSAEECFEQHARLITDTKRYKPVMDAKPDIPEMFKQLQKCGYATATNYAQSLVNTYNNSIKPYIEELEVTIKSKH